MHSASNSLIADFAAAISVLKVKGGLNRVIAAISFNAPQLYAPAEISMATVLKAYSDVLDAWDQARATGKVSGSSKWPLLVIDEANKLMAWQGHYDTELQQLLSFFVAITKANNRSHVMLATSEYGFLAWLNKGTPALLQARVCGGNAGALKRAANRFSGNWQSVLGAQPLEAMVQANLAALRPYSYWAADIDVTAFGADKLFTVVTAPAPLHFYLLEDMRSTLTAAMYPQTPRVCLTVWLSRQSPKDCRGAGSVRKVEKQVEEASSKIDESKAAKSEGWQGEVADLQQDKQRLVDEQRQLQEEKARLQEEKMLLLKRRIR
ncbi:hypothetical protein COO60DRAFT_1266184 [Scenedesmus sp. NREL 46B-D3]|nr:hypothetical protein COO60DRAFT_1266184 [Scenedesmus sp. NREL 46B-D3]